MTARPMNPAALLKVEQAYDSPPWWYDLRGFFILTFAYRSTLWQQVRLFSDNIGDGEHLEAAIGTGTLFRLVQLYRRLRGLPPGQVTGFDYAPAMLAGARRLAGPNLSLWHADAADLPFASDSYDSANIANAVHCFPDVDGSLRELHRVLKPGGRLAVNVLLTPRGWAPLRALAERIDRWGQRKGLLERPYEADDFLARLRRAGFEVVEQRERGNTLDVVARKPAQVSGELARAAGDAR